MAQSIGQMYITCGWLEAILYGINCMLFALYLQIFAITTTSSRRILATATVQFILSTAHVIISLVQLLQAFTPGGNPDTYYMNHGTLFVLGFYVYMTNGYIQEFLLIWRAYCLWGRKWKIIPLVFSVIHICIGVTAAASLIPSTAMAKAHQLVHLGVTGWGLETAANFFSTIAIAYRLWKVDRTTAVLGSRRRLNYRGILLLILECGALITTCTIIMFSLFASGHPAGLAGVGIAAQIASMSPLLIIVRMSIAQFNLTPQSSATYPLEISIFRTHGSASLQVGGKSQKICAVDGAVSSSTEDTTKSDLQQEYSQV